MLGTLQSSGTSKNSVDRHLETPIKAAFPDDMGTLLKTLPNKLLIINTHDQPPWHR
ncbi:MAG: hypothetical protein ACU85E_00530 [Gammaproteobacteria bacterium]